MIPSLNWTERGRAPLFQATKNCSAEWRMMHDCTKKGGYFLFDYDDNAYIDYFGL